MPFIADCFTHPQTAARISRTANLDRDDRIAVRIRSASSDQKKI
jgi:hypothetical protein